MFLGRQLILLTFYFRNVLVGLWKTEPLIKLKAPCASSKMLYFWYFKFDKGPYPILKNMIKTKTTGMLAKKLAEFHPTIANNNVQESSTIQR